MPLMFFFIHSLIPTPSTVCECFRKSIDGWISGKAVARGHLSQQFATSSEKDNGDAGLPPEMLQIAEIFRTLKQPGARLARDQRQHQNDWFVLQANRLE